MQDSRTLNVRNVARLRRTFRGLGDLTPGAFSQLSQFEALWTAALANNDAGSAASALSGASSVAHDLGADPSVAPATGSILGAIEADAAQLAAAAAGGDLSFNGSDQLAHLNGNVNLLAAGANAYVTGANVTAQDSAATAAGLASRQATLQTNIGAFQAGSKWSPAEVLGVSAERIAPLQDQWQSIDQAIRNASLLDVDRAPLEATQATILRVLGGKVAAASSAGSGAGGILDCINDPTSAACQKAPSICSLLPAGIGQWVCANPGKSALGALALLVLVSRATRR